MSEHPAFQEAHALGPAAKLRLLGLDRRSVTVYMLLLDEPLLDIPGIAAELSLSGTSVRNALDELGRHSLVRASQSSSGGWRAISPDVALPHLVEHLEAELHERQAALAHLRTEIASVVAEYRIHHENRTSALFERLDGIDAVVSRMEELGAQAGEEILAMMPSKPSAQGLEESTAADVAALRRGVRLRTLHLSSHVEDKDFRRHLEQFAVLGGQSRLRPTLPVRMNIIDRRIAVVAIDPAEPLLGAIAFHGRGILAALVALFDEYWESAASLNSPAAEAVALNPSERATLRLLARGLKDESIARHLGVSVRTTRRLIADLSERCEAGSRFQLAVRAQERGWL